MEIFDAVDRVGKTEDRLHFQIVIGHVRTVASAPFGFVVKGRRERRDVFALRILFAVALRFRLGILFAVPAVARIGLLAQHFVDIIDNAVTVQEVLLGKGAVLVFEFQMQSEPLVYHRLLAHDLGKIFKGHVDVGKDLKVGLPGDDRSGAAFAPVFLLKLARGLAFFEFDVVFSVAGIACDVHELRAVLRGARTETVETERVAVGFALFVVVIFSARVKLAENKIPVVALFFFVPVERDSASEVLDRDRMITRDRHVDHVAVALARFVDGVGKDLEKGMLTALQSVRTENDRRAGAHPLRSLKRGYTVVSVIVLLFRHTLRPLFFVSSAAFSRRCAYYYTLTYIV